VPSLTCSRPSPHTVTGVTRDQLILEHLPQVRLIARRIQERLPQHIGLEDLISTGILGLIAAIDHFDPKHKVKLKTYAEYKIRGAILDSLRGMDWAPRQKRRRAKRIESAVAAMEQRLQRPPTEEETAAELQVSLAEFREWAVQARGMHLERLRRVPGDREGDVLDSLPDSDERLPSRIVERAELRRLLEEVMCRIPQVERMVLRLYYQEGMTLREIARIVNVHESRISQLKTQAILRLRSRVGKYWPTPRGR